MSEGYWAVGSWPGGPIDTSKSKTWPKDLDVREKILWIIAEWNGERFVNCLIPNCKRVEFIANVSELPDLEPLQILADERGLVIRSGLEQHLGRTVVTVQAVQS